MREGENPPGRLPSRIVRFHRLGEREMEVMGVRLTFWRCPECGSEIGTPLDPEGITAFCTGRNFDGSHWRHTHTRLMVRVEPKPMVRQLARRKHKVAA
jgi:hypothetical protein